MLGQGTQKAALLAQGLGALLRAVCFLQVAYEEEDC